MPNTNKVLIHRKCCHSSGTDILQVDKKVGEMSYIGLFPRANGAEGNGCCYIEWFHAKSVCQTVKLYYGQVNKTDPDELGRIYMPDTGPGGTFGGMYQFDNNGEAVDDGTLEFCPNNSADCANPQVLSFESSSMTETHQIPIDNGSGSGGGWVELKVDEGELPWVKDDFDEWVDNTVLDDVYFCTEGAWNGGCVDGKETDYMTKTITICGRIYPSFLINFPFHEYNVTDGDGSTCAESDQCPPPTPVEGEIGGDPHVTTFFGEKYDM